MGTLIQGHSKSNVTHLGFSEIGNIAQPQWSEYVSEDHSSLYTKFCVVSLRFESLILILVCWKEVIDLPILKYGLLSSFLNKDQGCVREIY